MSRGFMFAFVLSDYNVGATKVNFCFNLVFALSCLLQLCQILQQFIDSSDFHTIPRSLYFNLPHSSLLMLSAAMHM